MCEENKPADMPVEMANDEGADPSNDIKQQNPGGMPRERSGQGNVDNKQDEEPELDASQAHPS